MVYLSHVLSAYTPTYGGKDLCNIEKVKKISNGDTSNNSHIHLSSHVGTHIDAPYHFCEDGKTIDEYPPEFWVCKNPWVINLNIKKNELISYNSIQGQLNEIPKSTEILFIRTGFEKYRNMNDKDKFIFQGPGIQADIGYWLRKKTSIKMIGLDFISLSSFVHREEGRLAHQAFLCNHEKDGIRFDPILIIEDMNLINYNKDIENIIVLPLRTKRADGAPVTVVGW